MNSESKFLASNTFAVDYSKPCPRIHWYILAKVHAVSSTNFVYARSHRITIYMSYVLVVIVNILIVEMLLQNFYLAFEFFLRLLFVFGVFGWHKKFLQSPFERTAEVVLEKRIQNGVYE